VVSISSAVVVALAFGWALPAHGQMGGCANDADELAAVRAVSLSDAGSRQSEFAGYSLQQGGPCLARIESGAWGVVPRDLAAFELARQERLANRIHRAQQETRHDEQ
jgi:hypothetical protein